MVAAAMMTDLVRAIPSSRASARSSTYTRQTRTGMVVSRCGSPLASEVCLLVVRVAVARRYWNTLGPRRQGIVHDPGGVAAGGVTGMPTAIVRSAGASDGVVYATTHSLFTMSKVMMATCSPCSVLVEARVSGSGSRHMGIVTACSAAVVTARSRCGSVIEARAIRQTAGISSVTTLTRGKITPVRALLGASVVPARGLVETNSRIRGTMAALIQIASLVGGIVFIAALVEFVGMCAGASQA